VFTLGLNLDIWTFTEATEKLDRKEINIPVYAYFTAIAETEDSFLVGTSNGAVAFYNTNLESDLVVLQQLFEVQTISQINVVGCKILVGSK